jgi:glycerol-3-phosphate acyltransferase PlsY
MEFVLLVAAYLLGSIPVAWIVTRLVAGEDLRTLGSGNVGVMNVALSVARWAGLLVLAGEAAKGILVVLLAQHWGVSDLYQGLAVVAAVAGTHWSVWMRGAGGRGNTAGTAALLLIAWQSVALSLAIWILVRLLARSSFLATRIWLLSLPVTLGLVTASWTAAVWGSALSLIYLSAHSKQTDDHTIIKANWPTLWDFLTAPRR